MALTGGVRQSLTDIYSGFRNAGASHTEAANLAGVTFYESGRTGYTGSYGGQPTERGGVLNPGGAYGIPQLNGSRQADLLNFANKAGTSPSDPQTQYNFIYQDAQNRGINLNSTADIVNRYEVPKVSLRPTEIAQSSQLSQSIDPSSYSGAPTGSDGLGYNPAGSTPVGGNVETSAGSQITGFTSATGNENDASEVTLGFPSGGSDMGSGINGASFSNANVSGGAQAGSFGLSGIMSGGSTVGAGNSGTGGTSSGPVGFNAGGPVTANPDLVSATNKVASNTASGDKAITDGVKTAGQTIGQAITSQSQSWLDWIKDSFIRLAFIVTGLVLFAAALYYFARPQIDDAVSTVGKVAKKLPIPIP